MRYQNFTNIQLSWERETALMNIKNAKLYGVSYRKLTLLKSKFYSVESEMKKRGLLISLTPWEEVYK